MVARLKQLVNDPVYGGKIRARLRALRDANNTEELLEQLRKWTRMQKGGMSADAFDGTYKLTEDEISEILEDPRDGDSSLR